MAKTRKSSKQILEVKRYALILATIWTLLLVGFGLWSARDEMEEARELVRSKASAHFLKDQALRYWAASHGGVYVPPTEHSPPNPHLSHIPDRDIETATGKQLTLMNPAYLVRQLMDYEEVDGVKGRITSLQPLRSANAPDAWERAALESFERGERQAEEFTVIATEPYLRLMRPMIVKQPCLKCHEQQGYKVDDIRGGVGVSVPAGPFFATARSAITHNSVGLGLIWLLGMVGIAFGAQNVRLRIGDRDQAVRGRAKTTMQTVIEGFPESLMLINRDHTVALANQAARNFSGPDPVATGMKCHQVSHRSDTPCEAPQHQCPLKQVVATKAPVTLEHTHRDAQGQAKSVEVVAVPICDEEGEVLQILEICRDITDRKQAENERAAHVDFIVQTARIDRAIRKATDPEQMMSDVLQGTLEIFACDRAWLLYPCDPEAESWSVPMERTRPEYPGAHALGQAIAMAPEVAAVLRDALDRDDVVTIDPLGPEAAKQTNERFSTRAQMHTVVHPRTGKPWVFGIHQCSGSRAWTEQEKELFRAIGRRISDGLSSLLFLRELRKEKQLSEEYINSLPGLFYVFDEQRFVTWNSEWNRVTGYSDEELAVRYGTDFFEGEDRTLIRERMEQVFSDGVADAEAEVVTKHGQRIPYLFTGLRKKWSGKDYLVGLGMNITRRKQAEQERLDLERQVQHSQKLESLGILAGGIAHDFNNILMGVLGYADLTLTSLPPHSPVKNFVEEIHKAAQRAAGLAQQMLAYSGKGRFVIEPIRINELVEEMSHMLEISLSKKAVIKYHFDDNLPVFDGDDTQIRQVIMNLITNASEAVGDKSGYVAISTGAMSCDRAYLDSVDSVFRAIDESLPEALYVYIEVADTGCGMTAETLSKLFDPFFTTKFTGRGLGMAAVQGIVRGHKGAIKVYSEVGKGTTFKVLFPVTQAAAELPGSQAPDEKNGDEWRGSGTVLVADDEESVRAIAKLRLEQLGFDVLTAIDGRHAVDIFSANADAIVCVLLDLTMPHLDGEQVFTEIRRIKPVKVILSSGYNEQEATQRFAGKGLAGFVRKPYTHATLAAEMRKALGATRDNS